MDLKQLEYFRHVAELGSFTRAASFLSVVQPALSRQVRQLEVVLGQNLFARNGRVAGPAVRSAPRPHGTPCICSRCSTTSFSCSRRSSRAASRAGLLRNA